jgi:tetratricopeptide (TPR) repeat protein
VAAALVALQQAPAAPASELGQAKALLAAGRLEPARRIAERLAGQRPDDPAPLVVLGRIWLAWPAFGRYTADSILARAEALDSADPAPAYYRSLVGLRLGGDDGEAMARRALRRVLSLDPHYRDAWPLWLSLYRDDRDRSEMVDVLAGHAGDHAADLWRAGLLVELRRYAAAGPLLDSLVAASPDDPAPRAWLARALFEQGRDAAAAPVYAAAVRRAAADTGAVLWQQVRSIASPQERVRWAALRPDERPAFLRLFWDGRNPDLRDSVNARIGEHFRRLVEARRDYALLHPLSRWHHSRLWRTIMGGVGLPASEASEVGSIRSDIAQSRHPSVADAPVAAGDAARLDDTTQETVNLEDGLDDRGRILVRYGEPQRREIWSTDAETWWYDLPQGQYQVTFVRRTSDGGGDEVVTPVVAGEARAARHLLDTDRPGTTASLRTFFWPAAFRTGRGDSTEVTIFPDSVAALAVLFDAAGEPAARDSAAAGRPLRLVAPPGPFLLALDASRGSARGGYRGPLTVPSFPPDSLTVSSLLIASGSVAPTRAALEAAAPPALRLPAGRPLRVYAELYGLPGDSGVARYDAVYRFERASRGWFGALARHRVITITFRRTIPAADPAVESLVIDPGRLPRGHYRLVLEINDVVRGVRAASGTLDFDLR